ncbi:semaphorin-7A [Erpetoichthys calabaricus]|uniref:Semaphorin 7A (JohnMiltonHagen blood group) n=1 Tax=Erpetoichthys calabaricus TaxID=27687 RepID=A0A8C4XHQ8_ERPCA|nr:semaphorin-7A [Erpetoichthys calabaricus]
MASAGLCCCVLVICSVIVPDYTSVIPRLIEKIHDEARSFSLPKNSSHIILLQYNKSHLYVAGDQFLVSINLQTNKTKKEFQLIVEEDKKENQHKTCLTALKKKGDSKLLCWINQGKPFCQEEDGEYKANGISLKCGAHGSLMLFVENEIYAAAPLYPSGQNLQFRKIRNNRMVVWMYDTWVSEPTFIQASWIKKKEDPSQDKIYTFFREKNTDKSPDADPWISRVAQVCKNDEGGSETVLQNIWSSFLKARLMCGIPSDSIYFNRLHDVFVVEADKWRDSKVYGLFSSSWNSTAVCVYSVGQIEKIFQTSKFKGYDGPIPSQRPGSCVQNSRLLSDDVLNLLKSHPEIEDRVFPIKSDSPLLISQKMYSKIVVDQVIGAHGNIYNVLLLATGDGKIHKMTDTGDKPFIIAEIHPINAIASILSMSLDSKAKRLFVAYPSEVVEVNLETCSSYNESCQECVLARDPYCAWDGKTSLSATSGKHVIQNVEKGDIGVCFKGNRRRRDTSISPSTSSKVISITVPNSIPYFLSCPLTSYHARYFWKHENGSNVECELTESECLYLIRKMQSQDYGNYECISVERDYTKTLVMYNLKESSGSLMLSCSVLMIMWAVVFVSLPISY